MGRKQRNHTSKTPGDDYGDPADQPDFTPDNVRRRVTDFLADKRNTRRGGFGIKLSTLLLRRLRSAVLHITAALREFDVSYEAFAHVWKFVRDLIVQVWQIEHDVLPADAPLRAWINELRRAELRIKDDDITPVREFFDETSWPEGQEVPPPEVARKGLGPLQFWRVFYQARQLTLGNIERWESAERKRKERAAKKGEDAESEEDEVQRDPTPPPPPPPPPKKPRARPTKPPAASTPTPAASKNTAPSAKKAAPPVKPNAPPPKGPNTQPARVSQPPPARNTAPPLPPPARNTAPPLRLQGPTPDAEAAQRPVRKAAAIANKEVFGDVTDIGPDAGDAPEDADYVPDANDGSDGAMLVDPSETDQLVNEGDADNYGDADMNAPPASPDLPPFGSLPDDRAASVRSTNASPAPREDFDMEDAAPSWNTTNAVTSGSAGKKGGQEKRVVIESPSHQPTSTNRASATRPNASDAQAGPSGPRRRRPPPTAPDPMSDEGSSSGEDGNGDEESEEDADADVDADMEVAKTSGKGKGKARQAPQKKKKKKADHRGPAMLPGGGVVLRDAVEGGEGRAVQPATHEDLRRAYGGLGDSNATRDEPRSLHHQEERRSSRSRRAYGLSAYPMRSFSGSRPNDDDDDDDDNNLAAYVHDLALSNERLNERVSGHSHLLSKIHAETAATTALVRFIGNGLHPHWAAVSGQVSAQHGPIASLYQPAMSAGHESLPNGTAVTNPVLQNSGSGSVQAQEQHSGLQNAVSHVPQAGAQAGSGSQGDTEDSRLLRMMAHVETLFANSHQSNVTSLDNLERKLTDEIAKHGAATAGEMASLKAENTALASTLAQDKVDMAKEIADIRKQLRDLYDAKDREKREKKRLKRDAHAGQSAQKEGDATALSATGRDGPPPVVTPGPDGVLSNVRVQGVSMPQTQGQQTSLPPRPVLSNEGPASLQEPPTAPPIPPQKTPGPLDADAGPLEPVAGMSVSQLDDVRGEETMDVDGPSRTGLFGSAPTVPECVTPIPPPTVVVEAPRLGPQTASLAAPNVQPPSPATAARSTNSVPSGMLADATPGRGQSVRPHPEDNERTSPQGVGQGQAPVDANAEGADDGDIESDDAMFNHINLGGKPGTAPKRKVAGDDDDEDADVPQKKRAKKDTKPRSTKAKPTALPVPEPTATGGHNLRSPRGKSARARSRAD